MGLGTEIAVAGHAGRDIQHLLRQSVKRTVRERLFCIFPIAMESGRMESERLPKIVKLARTARR